MEELAYKTKGVCIPMLFSQLGAFGQPRGGSWGTGKFTLGIDRRAGGGQKKKTASTILRERKEKTGTRKFLRPSFRPSKRFIY